MTGAKSHQLRIQEVQMEFTCSKYAYFSQVDIELMHSLRILVDSCTLEREI